MAEHWERLRAPLHGHLAAGLSDGEQDALTTRLGLRLPAELRALYGWHNGVQSEIRDWLYPSFDFLALSLAVDETLSRRRVRAAIEDLPRELVFQSSWLATFTQTDGSCLACDCTDPSIARFHCFDSEGGPEPDIVAPSLTVLLDWWLEVFEAGDVIVSEPVGLQLTKDFVRQLTDDSRKRFLGW